MKNWPRSVRPVLVAALVGLATILPAATANAGILVNSESAANCNAQVLEQPFKRWLDYFSYTLDPGGDFESGSPAWSLSRASVVSGNEAFDVGGANDSQSLALGGSGVAQSRPICVGIEHPTLRFFARRTSGWLLDSLKVEVLFEGAGGRVNSLPVGVVLAGGSWQPTLPYPVLASLLPLLPGEQTPVAFRFTPVGGAGWQIDDVFVDPWRSR